MKSLPVLLRDPKILLIGGGKAALQKAAVLVDNEIEFFIVSEGFISEFADFPVDKIDRRFCIEDVKGVGVVINATGDKSVTALLLQEQKKRHFLLNVVDVPEYSDFYFSALVRAGRLKIAVSSDGASPAATQVIRRAIGEMIPKELASFLDEKAKVRSDGVVNAEQIRADVQSMFCTVSLISFHSANVDLLTLSAYRKMLHSDIIFCEPILVNIPTEASISHVEIEILDADSFHMVMKDVADQKKVCILCSEPLEPETVLFINTLKREFSISKVIGIS